MLLWKYVFSICLLLPHPTHPPDLPKWFFDMFGKTKKWKNIWIFKKWKFEVDFSKKMRLEICYMERCLNFLYELMQACKQPFEISIFFVNLSLSFKFWTWKYPASFLMCLVVLGVFFEFSLFFVELGKPKSTWRSGRILFPVIHIITNTTNN